MVVITPSAPVFPLGDRGNIVPGSEGVLSAGPFIAAWPLAAGYTFQYAQPQSVMRAVLTLYIDNSTNNAAVSLTMAGTNQIIRMAANSQGYRNVLAPNPFGFVITCAAGIVSTKVFLLNILLPSQTWT